MILIRMLDQAGMGLYFIALLVADLLVMLSEFGITLALVKKYPETSLENRASLLRAAIALRLFVSLAFCAALLLVVNLAEIEILQSARSYIAPIATLFLLHAFRGLLLGILQARQQFGDYALTQALGALVKVLLVLSLAISPIDPPTINHVPDC